MDMTEFFASVERTMLARYRETELIHHAGDRGVNREELLRDLLEKHLPSRYGVVKGEMVTQSGESTHSADVIIYDKINCPVLHSGETAVVPIEGVYGIIEVKSRLSKAKLLTAMTQIESFKRLAPRELSVIQTREYMTVHRPSRPFGIILAFELADNSLASLLENVKEQHDRIHDVNFFTNLVCVLGTGLVYYEKADLDAGQRTLLLDTDEFVELVTTAHKREEHSEPPIEVYTSLVADDAGERSLGRWFVLLLIMLARLKLGVPDLGRYVDPDSPPIILRES